MASEYTQLFRHYNEEELGNNRSGRCGGLIGWTESVFSDFKNFINKGSILNLAIGIVIGEAFSSVVNSFVGDIFSPVLGLIISSKLSEAFLVIRKGPGFP